VSTGAKKGVKGSPVKKKERLTMVGKQKTGRGPHTGAYMSGGYLSVTVYSRGGGGMEEGGDGPASANS